MKLAEFNRLKKFMAMTMSDNDHEALLALKQANMVLMKESLTWQRVLDRSIKVYEEFDEAPPEHAGPMRGAGGAATARSGNGGDGGRTYTHDELTEAIDKIDNSTFDRQDGTFKYTIDSITKQFKQGKQLTPKQGALLIKTAACVDDDGVYRWRA